MVVSDFLSETTVFVSHSDKTGLALGLAPIGPLLSAKAGKQKSAREGAFEVWGLAEAVSI
jgi:hypothetical protein